MCRKYRKYLLIASINDIVCTNLLDLGPVDWYKMPVPVLQKSYDEFSDQHWLWIFRTHHIWFDTEGYRYCHYQLTKLLNSKKSEAKEPIRQVRRTKNARVNDGLPCQASGLTPLALLVAAFLFFGQNED